ncbi:MAG: hypothetical protein K8I82_13850 [Anaerolineae bacterium]|nr:hypothetical protein [Anaerolineae bacterium]
MSVQLPISYEMLVQLVEQLSEAQRQDLMRRLGATVSQHLPEEKLALLRTVQFEVEVLEEPSDRREDWYDDDGR